VVQEGPRELRGVKVVVHGPVVIGRAAGADIVVNGTYVSGRHARITAVGDDLTVEDLGSTNGTLVNGQRIAEPTLLAEGDLITIGDVTLRADRA
jgi:pSer/pThr/pTyr-binding forkhead associated (FHA) protein